MWPWYCLWIRQQLQAIHEFVYTSSVRNFSLLKMRPLSWDNREIVIIVKTIRQLNRWSPRKLAFWRRFSTRRSSRRSRNSKFINANKPRSFFSANFPADSVDTCGLLSHKAMTASAYGHACTLRVLSFQLDLKRKVNVKTPLRQASTNS